MGDRTRRGTRRGRLVVVVSCEQLEPPLYRWLCDGCQQTTGKTRDGVPPIGWVSFFFRVSTKDGPHFEAPKQICPACHAELELVLGSLVAYDRLHGTCPAHLPVSEVPAGGSSDGEGAGPERSGPV